MSTPAKLTAKGAATRDRIVEAGGRTRARPRRRRHQPRRHPGRDRDQKSQLFHYFPGGKSELVGAIADFQSRAGARRAASVPEPLDTWEAWEGWRDAVLAHYCSQPHWGCPIGSLVGELAGRDPVLAAQVAAHMDHWREYLAEGLERMRATGLLRADADPQVLALSTFAALQGGLLLAQTMESCAPLRAALDGALAALRYAASEAGR